MIESDIRRRGLAAGDRYLTAREVGRLLGVSTMTANRALQELAARRVLVRARRSGSVVGDRLAGGPPPSPRAVHLLVPSDFFTLEKALVDLIVSGIHSELPGDAIQFTFVPAQGEVEFVRRLVEAAPGTFGGAVLLVSSPAVQRFFRDRGLPAVVSGSLHPGISGLPWVDRDQREIGRLLARAALARRARQLVVLMRDRWGAGDNLMIEGVQSAAGSARVSVRSFPPDPDLVAGAVGEILRSAGRPAALLCRSRLLADAAARAASRDARIWLCDHHANDARPVPYPHTRPKLGPPEHGALIGRMLKDLARGRRPDPDHAVIPVELHEGDAP
jgi:DNA-binding LacI/PurR family transcriptional regulator